MFGVIWHRRNRIGLIYTLIFLAITVYGLAHRGLFFRPEQTYVGTWIILLGLIGLITLTVLKELMLPRWVIPMFAYAAYAWLSTLWAANAELAVGGAITITAAVTLAAFIPLLSLSWRRIFLSALSVAPALLYFFAMGTVFHWVQYANAIQNNMMDSVFQYHNTFGSFALAGALIALTLGMRTSKFYLQGLYYLITCINLVAVLASDSRSVWLLTPLMLLLLFVETFFTGNRNGWQGGVTIALVPLTALGAGVLSLAAIHQSSLRDFLLSMTVATVGIFTLTYLMRVVFAIPSKRMRQMATLALVLIPIFVGVSLLLLDAKHFASILTRLGSIRLHSSSLQGRFWFYGAALHMWEQSPIFGAGAGTWTAKFQAFQQFPYYSTMTHSVLMSQLTDFGIVGTLLWLVLIGWVIVRFLRTMRHHGEVAPVYLAAMLAALSLWIHAWMDFDLDFPTITYVFFVLLGLASPIETETLQSEQRSQLYGFKLSLLAGLAGVSMVSIGLSITEGAMKAATQVKTLAEKVQLLQRAEFFAPYVAAPHVNLATIYYSNFMVSHALGDRNQAWTEAQYAVKRGDWDPVVQNQMATLAYQLRYTQAYDWALRATQDAPFNMAFLTSFAGMALWIGVVESPQNPQGSQAVFHTILNQYSQAKQRVANLTSLPKDVTTQWISNIAAYKVGASLQAYAGAADYALGNYQQSVSDLQHLSKVGRDVNTMGLVEMVTLLDEAHLGRGTVLNVPNEMQYKNAVLLQEYQALLRVVPQH